MKVTAFNGSPRKNGNTAAMLNQVLVNLAGKGFETELYQLGGRLIRGCNACDWCKTHPEKRCVFNDDCINECIGKMDESDVVLIGSPTYFSSMTAETKALIDRAGRICRAQGLLRRKIGASVSPARRAGTMNVFHSINNFFLIQEMIVPGSTYWNVSLSTAEGDFAEDTEAVTVMNALSENIAWLAEKIR